MLGLTFLEYVVLSPGALAASILLYFNLDGHAGDGVTLPVAGPPPGASRSGSG